MKRLFRNNSHRAADIGEWRGLSSVASYFFHVWSVVYMSAAASFCVSPASALAALTSSGLGRWPAVVINSIVIYDIPYSTNIGLNVHIALAAGFIAGR